MPSSDPGPLTPRGRPSLSARTRRRLRHSLTQRRNARAALVDALDAEPARADGEPPMGNPRAEPSPATVREFHRSLAAAAHAALAETDAALQRLRDGTYGSCQVCDQPIPVQRLAAMPETPWCLGCHPTGTAPLLPSHLRHPR
jgi:RNA polymerase-binding transcription factor DksA